MLTRFKLTKINSIEKRTYNGKVHDLTVENDHSYVANNIVVHNSLCTTRVMTGCGIPTLQSVMDVQSVVYDTMDIIADGGIRNSGDIVKSLAAGANAVMLGSIFAGTKEAPGDVILGPDGKKYKVYRGSASFGDKKTRGEETRNIEGTETLVEYKGSISDIIPDLLDGIRSGFSYLGNQDNTDYIKFVHITNNGLNESKPHGVKYV